MAEYIARERLKKAFNADLQILQTLDEHTMSLLFMEIDETPTADVAPVVHGRWDDITTGLLASVKCSACGAAFQGYYADYQYCPRCGAKMDGGKDDAD